MTALAPEGGFFKLTHPLNSNPAAHFAPRKKMRRLHLVKAPHLAEFSIIYSGIEVVPFTVSVPAAPAAPVPGCPPPTLTV
jgi:hypothetical protein